jgi:tetratricopeptide (TPR) repeat protein
MLLIVMALPALAAAGGADSLATGGAPPESPPAPLIVPGRPAPADTAGKSRASRAREQYRLGLALEGRKLPAPAIAAYRNAVRFDPTIADANYRMGTLFLGVGQLEEAVKCFAAEVRYHPGNAVATRELGLGLARLGRTDRAITTLEGLTRRRPNDGDSWQALGFAYMAAKRPRDAEIALRRAVVLAPPRASRHRDLGAVLAARGRDGDAREQYRRALVLEPRDAATWINLGNLERRAGKFEAALKDYREAERRDSTMGLAFQGQVQSLRDLGRTAEAAAVYRRWLGDNPTDHTARLEAVRFFDGLDRRDIALEIARDGVRRDDESGDAHLILGMALEASGATRAALGEVRKAEERFKTPAEKGRARQLVAVLRASAADSLKGLFAADSIGHPEPARR